MINFSLSGKVVAVTGTTRGIGRSLALALASAGADIVQINRSPSDQTEREITELGSRSVQLRFDLATCERSDCDRLFADAVEAFGRLDVLVNSGGVVNRGPFLSMTQDAEDAVIRIDVRTPMMLARAAAPHLEQSGDGRIINIASLMSFQGGMNVAAYAVAKHGLVGMTKALANEWGGRGIRVNAIAPGFIATEINSDLQNDPTRKAEFSARIPLGRWGTPEDLSGAAIFLSSPASSYVTGTVLVVDGGWLSR